MVIKFVVGVTVFLVATIAVARGIRAADWDGMYSAPVYAAVQWQE